MMNTPLFYGRRKTRPLSQAQQQAWTDTVPTLNLEKWQNNWPHNLWLEIGFGLGHHLLAFMEQNPTRHVIGAEVFINGVAHFVQHLPIQDHTRCALVTQPIQTIWPLLPDGLLEGILLYFPDPWPKKRHQKRRLLQQDFLQTCARVLMPKGVFCFASDHPCMIEHGLTMLEQAPGFTWHAGARDPNPQTWPAWPADVPMSRYQEKALAEGRMCMHTVWQKA